MTVGNSSSQTCGIIIKKAAIVEVPALTADEQQASIGIVSHNKVASQPLVFFRRRRPRPGNARS